MKIAMISQYFHPVVGGIETHIFEIATRLTAMGHEVEVHASASKPKEPNYMKSCIKEMNGFKVIYEPEIFSKIVNGLRIPKISKDVDIIHIHNYTRFLFSATVFKYYGHKKLICTPHGGLIGPFFEERTITNRLKIILDGLFAKTNLNKMNMIIALNNFEKDFLMTSFHIPSSKIEIIPNGVNASSLIKPNLELLNKFDLNNKKYIVSVCRLHPLKNLEQIILVLPSLPEDINYVIVGPDAGSLDKIIQLARTLKVEHRVKYLGPLFGDEKDSVISGAIAFVLPSKFEAQPIVLLEAIALGVPVVASRVGGTSEIIIHDELGYLFNYADTTALKKHLDILIKNNRFEKILKQTTRSKVLNNYSWDHTSKSLEKIYAEILI